MKEIQDNLNKIKELLISDNFELANTCIQTKTGLMDIFLK